jgi:hypothetical protein
VSAEVAGSTRRWIGVAGLVLHLAVGVVPYAGSGLVAPPGGVALLWAVWAALLAAAVVLLTRRPALVPLVPVVAVTVWVGVVGLGDALLGWTA